MFRRAILNGLLLAVFVASSVFALQPNNAQAATAQKAGSMHFLQCRQYIGNKDGAARYTVHVYGQNDTNKGAWIGAREYPSLTNVRYEYSSAHYYFDYSYGSFVLKDRLQFYLYPNWGNPISVQNLSVCKRG